MLEHFQAIMAFINHGMLHHYTIPVINNRTIYPYINKIETEIRNWSNNEGRKGNDYETWAHIGHEKILLDPDNVHLVEEVIPTLDKYFMGLKELGAAMMLSGHSAKAHEVIDYLGMLMMQAVTRVFPLNHPITQGCLDLLELADPAPGEASGDCMKMFGVEEIEVLNKEQTEIFSLFRRRASYKHSDAWEVMRTYEQQGLEIFPRDGKANYTHYKMLQLVAMGGLEAHTPDLPSLKKLQDDTGEITLNMLKAAAKTVKLKL